jgi:hypothetical protein
VEVPHYLIAEINPKAGDGKATYCDRHHFLCCERALSLNWGRSHALETKKMGRKPNQICAHCNQPIATPRKRRHVGYDGWLKGHAPLIIAMYKEGKGADTILGVLASKKDVILHYGGNPNWKMALRGTIFYILARHGFAYHGAVANRTIRKSAGADARLIENYDDAA